MRVTVQQLFAADHSLQGPLVIDFGENSFLRVEKILRYLPGKRIACKAVWRDEMVFAKLFNSEADSNGHQRELHGHELLIKNDINTPALLENTAISRCRLLCYEFLEGKPLIKDTQQAFVFSARLHNANLIHTDLHADNLMVANNKLYLLDAGAVTQTGSEKEKLKNLAMFIAQSRLSQHEKLIAARCFYEEIRGFTLDVDLLTREVRSYWEKRKNDYLKKVFRNSTDVHALKNKAQFVLVRRSCLTASLKAILENPDKAIDEGVILKDGNSQTVSQVVVDDMPLVIKRYNQNTIWTRIKRKLGFSRARNCWRYAHLLSMAGIKTPIPVAIIEVAKGAAYYICMYAGGEKLSLYYKKGKNIDLLMRPLRRLFYRMHAARLTHGDLKAANIMVSDGKLSLIDLDAMTENALNYSYRRKKDLNRFLENFQGSEDFIKIKNDLLKDDAGE